MAWFFFLLKREKKKQDQQRFHFLSTSVIKEMFLGDLEFFEKTEFSHHYNPKHKKVHFYPMNQLF